MVSIGPTGNNPVIQIVHSSTSSRVACTTAMPYDNTIPQITEGTQVLTATITPKSASNILYILYQGFCGAGATATTYCFALFQDATAGALAAAATTNNNSTFRSSHSLAYKMLAGTTSATTFQIRLGNQTAANTWEINGDGAGNRVGGGTASTTLTIWEYQA